MTKDHINVLCRHRDGQGLSILSTPSFEILPEAIVTGSMVFIRRPGETAYRQGAVQYMEASSYIMPNDAEEVPD